MKLMKSTVTVAAVGCYSAALSRKRRPVRSPTSVRTRAICSRLRAPSRRKCATKRSRQSAVVGQLRHRAAGKFRFIYEKPYKQTIVSDGTTVWLYDEDLNQVTIRKLGDTVSEQPLALLLDPTAADKLFELKALDPAGSIGYVEAKSTKADAPFTTCG